MLLRTALNKADTKVKVTKIENASAEEFSGQNVFEKWLDDKEEDIAKGFQLDKEESDNFSIPKLVKNKDD